MTSFIPRRTSLENLVNVSSAVCLTTTDTEPAAISPVAAPSDRHFDTSHLKGNLAGRTMRSGAVTLSAQSIKFALRLGSTAILARLLSPDDFGLIAMVTAITGFVELFKDAGLSMATVQREEINHAQVSTLFWINVALSAAVMLILAALSPAIAWFYDEPRLLKITLALAGTMIFGGLAVQHQALLRRNLQFGRLAAIEILSILAGVTVAILMARQGWSYWSLVAMTAATSAAAAVLSLLFSGWIPGLPVRGSGVRSLLHVGGSLSAASLIGYFGRTGDSLIVGQWFGAQPVGLYNRAMVLLLAPWYQFVHPIHCVLEPALCRVRFEPERFKQLYQQYLSLSAAVTIPTTIVLALNSRMIVRVVLGEAWMDVAPIFVALFPAALTAGLRPGVGWLFTPLGRPHLHLRWSAFSTPVVFLACLIGACFSPVGVAAGLSVSQFLLLVIGIEYGVRETFLQRRDVWLCILPSALAAGVGTLVFFAVVSYSELLASILLLLCSFLLTVAIQSAVKVPSIWAHAAQRARSVFARWMTKNPLVNEGIVECP